MSDAEQTSLVSSVAPKHRSVPIAETLTHINGYPTKLVIFKLPASPFWWVRYYADGKILKRSTKELDKKRAIAAAKVFYDEINYRKHAGLPLSASTNYTFEHSAYATLDMQFARVKRGELTKMVHENDEWRLKKHVLPFFKSYTVDKIDYFALELFLRKVSEDKLSQSTKIAYMSIVKKVLTYAKQKGLIKELPAFPKLKKEDSPRGWFTTREYRNHHPIPSRSSSYESR